MAIPPSKMNKSTNQQVVQKCSCDPLSKYDEKIDSSWADWTITNCGGLAFREKDQWINADMGDSIMAALNKNRGYETVENKKSSYLASTKGVCCDIKFYYWIVRNGLIGKDKNGNYSKGSLNFHIVSGRLSISGSEQANVYSTNGGGPLDGVGTFSKWAPNPFNDPFDNINGKEPYALIEKDSSLSNPNDFYKAPDLPPETPIIYTTSTGNINAAYLKDINNADNYVFGSAASYYEELVSEEVFYIDDQKFA